MNILILLGVFLAFSTAFAIAFKRRIEEAIPTTMFSIIILLYIFGLAKNLELGISVIKLISISLIIYIICSIYKNKKLVGQYILTPGIIIFMVIFFSTVLIHKGRVLMHWDEFSHWGLVVKNMFSLNDFGNNAEATTFFMGYPPATALFQYFCMKIIGSFKESFLFTSMNLLAISMFLPVIRDVKYKDFYKGIIAIGVLSLLPVAFYSTFYTTIYVDGMLGILFAYILYTYFVNDLDIFTTVSISLAVAVITLTKAAGFGLAIIALLIILVDILIYRRKEVVSFTNENNILNKILILMPVFMCIIAKLSWSKYLELTSTNAAWNTTGVNSNNFINVITGNGAQYQYTTIRAFIDAFFNKEIAGYFISLSFMGCLIAFGLASILLINNIKDKDESERVKVFLILTVVGALIYSFSMIILYLFTFSEYEATRLASFSRYMSTYLLGMMLVLGTISITFGEFRYKLKNALIIIMLIILSFSNIKPLTEIGTAISNEVRSPYNKIVHAANKINKGEKVYFISTDTNGFDYWVARFNFTPVKLNNNNSWSIGLKPYNENDIWTRIITAEEWSNELAKEYSYVYIYKADNEFINVYGELFEDTDDIESNTLFKIENNNKSVTLKKIEI